MTPYQKGSFGRQKHRIDPVGRARGERGAAGRGAGFPEGFQIRIPKVKMATRRVSERVRRTRSIVGMPWPTSGSADIFEGVMASLLRRKAGLVRGVSMVNTGVWEIVRRRVGRRDAWVSN